jgi:predicted RNase H-like HicB family nuclease
VTLDEYLAVPYILRMESIEQSDGDWVRRATYPELPGCEAEAATPVEAIERLEATKRRRITELLERGEPIPVPRAPLGAVANNAERGRFEFARWLADQGHIGN